MPKVPLPNAEPPHEEAPPAVPSLAKRARARLYRPMVLLAIGLIPMLFVLASYVGRSLPDLSGRPEYGVTAERIDLVDPPPWLPADFTARTLAAADLPKSPSLLDDGLVGQLATVFAASPWVESVTQIRKLATGRVVATLAFRRPVAMVRVRRVSYPVDADGVLLPAEDFSEAQARAFPLITDVTTSPAAAGVAWNDPVVLGAARVAESLGPEWHANGLAAIRLRTSESRGKPAEDLVYELVTEGGSLIVWGRAPGSTHPGELSVLQKLGKISRYLTRFESFEKPNGPYEIDIRHWREITRQRIAGANVGRS